RPTPGRCWSGCATRESCPNEKRGYMRRHAAGGFGTSFEVGNAAEWWRPRNGTRMARRLLTRCERLLRRPTQTPAGCTAPTKAGIALLFLRIVEMVTLRVPPMLFT